MDSTDPHTRRFPLQCAVDGVQVVADVEVTDDQVTITPFPGRPGIEIPVTGFTQLSARVIVAAHASPPPGGRAPRG